MSEYKKVKLGDIFTLEKGSLQSSKCTPGQYDFITAAEDWKTHESYTHDCEAIVYAVAASGSLGRAHYVNGKFIASDLCFIMQEKDKEKYPVNFQFYQIIFEVLRDEIVSKTKTGTSKESISQKNLSKYEIPYFDYDFQIANYERLVGTKQKIAEISKETESQKAYAKQLRQNILQDAIEGKLTAEWRKTHPVIKGNPDFDAEALFEEIQKGKAFPSLQPAKQSSATPSAGSNAARNARLKELQPITDDDKPFEIPDGWKLIRLGEIINLLSGRDFEPDGYNDKQIGIPYITGASNFGETGIIINRWTSDPKCIAKKGDLLLVCKGSGYGTLAYADFEKAHIARQVMSITPISANIYLKYIEYILQANFNYLKSQGKGLIPGIDRETILQIRCGLPSVLEQEEIVNKVESLLNKVTELENQIQERKQLSENLVFGVIKEKLER